MLKKAGILLESEAMNMGAAKAKGASLSISHKSQ